MRLLSPTSQQRLERLKFEILAEDTASSRPLPHPPHQRVLLPQQTSQTPRELQKNVIPVIDTALTTTTTLDRLRELHKTAARNKTQTANLLERYRRAKEKARDVVDRLGVVEGRLEKLESAARSDRLERLELLNHSVRFFGHQALERCGEFRQLKVGPSEIPV
ncbi:hypothetical protein TWF281_011528 [Arthrobotrys megalospora]